MASPDSDTRFHPTPEILVPISSDFAGKDIIFLEQFNRESLNHVFEATSAMKELAQRDLPPDHILRGVRVVLLFYEPSSRTRASFDAATKVLGGQTIVVENPQAFSSVSKGETLEDTIRTYQAYSDIIVLRHPEQGAAMRAAEVADVPIINAGDGIGEHPTQALLDMQTILDEKGRLDSLRGLMAGDILNGRTIHSLIQGLAFYPNNEIFLLAPEQLRLSREDILNFKSRGIVLHEIGSMDEVPKDLDFWYWTRVQKERFESEAEYNFVNNRFVVDQATLDRYASPDTILMHPLPRVGEIKEEVDSDPRAVYLRSQIRNGLYVREALLTLVLGKIK